MFHTMSPFLYAFSAILHSFTASAFVAVPIPRLPAAANVASSIPIPPSTQHLATPADTESNNDSSNNNDPFCLSTALLCGGLAFDAYVEPATNSSRWERGSGGLNVAYSSPSFTRSLYQGLLQVTIPRVTGLPQTESGTAERIISSSDGVDACVLVAVVEGQWEEDVRVLEREQFHEGVWDLTGAAHVTRTTTCWSSVTKAKAEASQERNGKVLPYFVPPSWGKGAAAVWPTGSNDPLYLYVQDPATARLVFTVLDADRLGPGIPVGSTYKRLSDLIPEAGFTDPQQLIDRMKEQVVARLQRKGLTATSDSIDPNLMAPKPPTWVGELPLTSKPRKRSKNSQIMAAAAAGAYVAGPAGAAVGAVFGNLYEGQVRGRIHAKLQYVPTSLSRVPPRKTYRVQGGLPGVDWGSLYSKYRSSLDLSGDGSSVDTIEGEDGAPETATIAADGDPLEDLEHCFFVSHAKTGATCVVYRSLAQKRIIVSFRGTCAPIDLVTDASLVQDAWIEGQDVTDQTIPKVHRGFRTSLNSIARRLKELLLATPGPDLSIEDFDMYVSGHSLGGALATLFTADIAEYGIDAGRALPQLAPAEPWWKGVARVVLGDSDGELEAQSPPRPKTLRLYNFGSPRVGNVAFSDLFSQLQTEGKVNCAYRIVNGEDVVARLPRTVNGLVFGKINYDHVGQTVLINAPESEASSAETTMEKPTEAEATSTALWIEGVSDDKECPIRDGSSLSSPMAEGMLLKDLVESAKKLTSKSESDSDSDAPSSSWSSRLSQVAAQVSERISTVQASDIPSVLGIEKKFTEREVKIFQSLLQGKAVGHHMEDQYYAGMGFASGFVARVGEEVEEMA